MGTITIDNVEHQIDDLTDVVKIKVSRMHEIQNQMNAMNRELAELQVVFQAMETVDFIVGLWPVAAGVFILVLTIGKILNRLDVMEQKMTEVWKAINELIRK
jgi:prefoldin subunit 5